VGFQEKHVNAALTQAKSTSSDPSLDDIKSKFVNDSKVRSSFDSLFFLAVQLMLIVNCVFGHRSASRPATSRTSQATMSCRKRANSNHTIFTFFLRNLQLKLDVYDTRKNLEVQAQKPKIEF
jgi:hypothetical protein